MECRCLRQLATLEGRILVQGEEELGRDAGRGYLMLEATDARIHYVCYTPEMEAARNHGGLRTNSFIRLRKVFSDGHPTVDSLGSVCARPSTQCSVLQCQLGFVCSMCARLETANATANI